MTLLDLQALEIEAASGPGKKPPGSRASKGCPIFPPPPPPGGSALSLILC